MLYATARGYATGKGEYPTEILYILYTARRVDTIGTREPQSQTEKR